MSSRPRNQPSRGFSQNKSRHSQPPAADQPPRGHRAVIGVHAVREAMKVRPRAVKYLWWNKGAKEQYKDLFVRASSLGCKIEEKAVGSLDKLGSGHQGLVAFLDQTPELDWQSLASEGPQVVIILDSIEDPHNLGAVLRSAWLLGAKAVFIPEVRSAPMTPSVAKIASGGAEHVPVVPSQLSNLIIDLKDKGFWIYGLAAEGQEQLFSLELPEKVAWVIGSEGTGMRSAITKACDLLVSIPQTDHEASLNASVAAGLALGESYRQLLNPRKS